MQTRLTILPTLFALALAGLFLFQSMPVDAESYEGTRAPEELYIDHFGVTGTVDHHYAITELSQLFKNPGEAAAEATFRVQIPERAFISNFSLEVDGDTYYGVVLPKDTAKQQYENASAAGHNTALLEAVDATTYQYSITVGAGDQSRLTVRYEEFLERRLGAYSYELYLSSVTGDYAIEEFSIDLDITAGTNIKNVQPPDAYPEMVVAQIDETSYTVTYSDTGGMDYADAFIVYKTAPTGQNGEFLSFGNENEGYFLHLFSPQQEQLGEDPLDKEIIFVLDSSGSMSGAKISQLKDAFGEIIQQLLSGDTFNLVEFDSTIKVYDSEVLPANQANKDEAESYINSISAGGSTNINGAMLEALDMVDHETSSLRVIVLLTDGQPTSGETHTPTIRSNVLNNNEWGATVFTLGFGYDLDYEFIEAMALENSGKAFRIEEGADAAQQMKDFYSGISVPLLSNITFVYSRSVIGETVPDKDYLFEGSELTVLGKYLDKDGDMTVTVQANAQSGTTKYVADYTLGGEEYDFIPRLWAYRRIMSLLDDVKVEGQGTDLVNSIVELAVEYSFVTPYTSLFIDVPEDEEPAEPADEGDTEGDGQVDSEDRNVDSDGVPDDTTVDMGSDPQDPGTNGGSPPPQDSGPTDGSDGGGGGSGGTDGTDGDDGYLISPSLADEPDSAKDGEGGDDGEGVGGWLIGDGDDSEDDSTGLSLLIILLSVIVPLVVVAAVLANSRRKKKDIPQDDDKDGKRD